MLKKLSLSLLSAFLLALPWLAEIGGWSLFVAFVPLLILQSQKPKKFGWWVALTFTLWIAASTWWVIKANIAAVAIPPVGLFFSWIPFMIYHYIWNRQKGALAWVVFVTAWISFEALYTYQDISFPWLNLGNGFMNMPWAVQWYEYTGTFGGTLWILVSNILFFELWKTGQKFKKGKTKRGLMLKRLTVWGIWIFIPMIASGIVYSTYKEQGNPVKVCIVQPNIDPHGEKFEGGLNQDEQAGRILKNASLAESGTKYIIAPETALDDQLWEETIDHNSRIDQIRHFIIANNNPDATFIIGAMTFKMKTRSDSEVSYSKRNYHVYNSALWIDSSDHVDIYHKSKLVVGAELTPYPELFGSLKIDLGGISGDFGRQKERDVNDRVGVAICYESIYGAYFTEYIDKGAEAMCIITNDGWWGNTQGHKHHLNMARLRAIETRRDIARSANTGISAIINQRGDIVEKLDWWKEGAINGTINLSSSKTFYVKYKDVIIRLSVFIFALSLLYFAGQRFRKKR